MLLSAKRLSFLLKNVGFELLSSNTKTKDIHFVRHSPVKNIFEHLHIVGQGKSGEAAYATTAIAGVRYFLPAACVAENDLQLLYALETDTSRHWTILHSLEDAKRWEIRLSEIIDSFASNTSVQKSSELIRRLDPVHHAINQYISLSGNPAAIFDREHAFFQTHSPQIRAEAERIASGSCIQDWSWDDVNLASLVLTSYGPQVEGKPDPWKDVVPIDSQEYLLPRIYLLSDYFYGHRLTYNYRNR